MQIPRRSFLIGTAASLACGPALAGGAARSVGGPAFGSYWRLTVEADAPDLSGPIRAVIAEVDAAMSPYRAGSALSGFNRAAARQAVPVPGALAGLAAQALDLAAATGGAFDPTVGPVVARYGFGPIVGTAGRWQDLRAEDGTLRKATPGLTLDLCGIAKGHAADRIAALLAARGIRSALIDIGGEMRALGPRPGGGPWRVAIADPTGARTTPAVVALADTALATSGPVPQGHAGRGTLSHLIDPRRGRPVTHALASVSVLAGSGAQADALATALAVLGPDAGAEYADAQGIAALFLTRTGAGGGLRSTMTGGFDRHRLG